MNLSSGYLLLYFVTATLFEFPYAVVKSEETGILLFALAWYITAPLGLLLVLFSYRSWKTP